MSACCRLLRYAAVKLLELTLVFLLVVYVPGLPPDGSFTATSITPSKPLEEPYSLNNFLNNADHLYVDKVKGPECFAEWKGELYTSVHGGEIVKLLPNGQVTPVAKIGLPCDGFWQESKCGRPLGIEFDKSGILYVVDAYYGIWKVNIASGQKQLLVSPSVEIEGRKPKVFNSLALASNGDFYWTDSSSDIYLEDGIFGMLLDGSGRLFHYDAAKNTSKVLLDGLWFANGVALSPREDFVLVSETARSQIRRYYLKGDKKGTDDIFVDGLPGVPDNLKAYPNFVFMPLVSPRDDTHPIIFQSLAPHPMLRKFVARIIGLVQLPFQLAQKVMPHYIFERAVHWLGHFESVQAIVGKRAAIVKIDWTGKVIDTWYNIDGTLTGISEAVIFKDNLYLGSPYNTYIGRVPIPFGNFEESVTFEQPKRQEAPKPKPTEAPKTTQKPTTKKPEPTEPPKTTQPPTKPPTQATKPPTQATKPPTQATKPPTQATKPPTQATKPAQASTTPPPTPKATQAPKTAKPTEKSTPPTKVPKEGKNTESTNPTPINEDIPSDTMPPQKEHLKVIKKDGPSEMPHPDTVKVEKPKAKSAQNKNEL